MKLCVNVKWFSHLEELNEFLDTIPATQIMHIDIVNNGFYATVVESKEEFVSGGSA